MAISIGDALLKLGVDSSELDSGMKKATDNIKQQMKTVGVALTGFGATVTGALALTVKSAAEEEAGIIKLTQALDNVGVAYDDVRESLEANIDATQQKTSIADSAQRESLQRLLEVTGDYQRSLDLLPLALDMAAAKGMDAASASEIIGRVAAGNTTILSRYGIQLKEGATATEALGALQQKFGGQAEAYGQSVAGQFALIKNNIGDLMESIGTTVLPIIRDFFTNTLNPLIQKLKAWADEHPNLIKQIVILAGVVGGFATILGPLLIMLPTLAASFAMLTGPIGWVILAVMGLVTAGTLLWQNWDKVSKFFVELWSNMKIVFANGVKFIINTVLLPFIEYWGKLIGGIALGLGKLVGIFNKELGATIEGIGQKLINARSEINEWADNLIDSEKVKQNAREVADSAEKMAKEVAQTELETTKALKAELQKQYQTSKDYYANQKTLAQKSTDDQKAEILKQTEEKKRATEKAISLLEKEYDAKLKTLYAERDAQLSALQEQIDDIDRQTEQEELALTRADEQKRLAELQAAAESAETAEDKAKTKQAYDEYYTQVQRNELLRQRNAEKDSLRQQMESVRAAAESEEVRLRQETDARIAEWERALDEFLELERIKSDNLDIALENELDRLAKEEEAISMSFDARISAAEAYQAELEATLKDVTQTVTTNYVTTGSSSGVGNPPAGAIDYGTQNGQRVALMPGGKYVPYAEGGIIPEPTLLSSLRTGLPYGIAAEHRPEWITPTKEPQTANITIMLDGRVIGRAIGQPLVDEIRVRTGVRI